MGDVSVFGSARGFNPHDKYLSWLDDCGDLGAVNGLLGKWVDEGAQVCERLIDRAFIKDGAT